MHSYQTHLSHDDFFAGLGIAIYYHLFEIFLKSILLFPYIVVFKPAVQVK